MNRPVTVLRGNIHPQHIKRVSGLIAAAFLCWFSTGHGADAGMTRSDLSAIGLAPEIGGTARFDLAFERIDGTTAPLSTIAAGRNTLLTFADFTCPSLCGVALAALSQSLAEGRLEIGQDFDLIIVGLDPADGFENRANLIESAGTGAGILEKAHFVRAGQTTIDDLTSAVGYSYQYDDDNDVYAHPNGVLVVEPGGTIAAAFNEFSISAEAIEETLLGNSQPLSLTKLIRSVCYNFDPLSGQYTLAINRVMKISGSLFVLILLGGLIVAHRRERTAHV